MSQALYTSMGGISVAQSQLSVVSNNIANINTIGFKESSVTFQDVFSITNTTGNTPTVTTGGKNPLQIGLGVQIGTIAKNMDSGTWTSTGKTTDMMIQGNGFFSAMSADGEVYLTKAGNFSFDANGDLVNAQGYKILGAESLYSTNSSKTAVNVPQKIVTAVAANEAMYDKELTALNNCQLTQGTFVINITDSGGTTTPVTITLDGTADTMGEVAAQIQRELTVALDPTAHAAQALADTATATEATAAQDLAEGTITQAQYDAIIAVQDPIITAQTAIVTTQNNNAMALYGIKVTCDATTDGTIQFATDGVDAKSLSFLAGTSNFVGQTQLAQVAGVTPASYSSKILDYVVDVTPVNSISNAVSVASSSVAEDGSIEATYSNGDKLTVELNENTNKFQFKYTTSSGVVITGDDVNVNPNVAIPANFQMQLANVVNPEGLVAQGGNLYTTGANSGDLMFTVGGSMGLGTIKTGGLEASNVDMSKQFSDMILAQRAVQANSRVFTTASDIMESIVMLGR